MIYLKMAERGRFLSGVYGLIRSVEKGGRGYTRDMNMATKLTREFH